MDRRVSSRICVVLLLVALLAGAGAVFFSRPAARTDGGRLTVGRDTSYRTEPLNADGRVDFLAAWRRDHSAGVTPENNAAPVFFAATGLDTTQFTTEERQALPKFAERFVDFQAWVARQGVELHEDVDATDVDPVRSSLAWTALGKGEVDCVDETAIADWFTTIDPSLDAIARAVERSRFYAPDEGLRLVLDREPVADSDPDPEHLVVPDVCRAFDWRALRRAHRDDFAGACADLLAALKSATLERTLDIPDHVREAASSERDAWESLRGLAHEHAAFSVADFERFAAAVDRTPPSARIASFLPWLRIQTLATLEFQFDDVRAKTGTMTGAKELLDSGHVLDLDRCARFVNTAFDRLEEAWRPELPWRERKSRAKAILDVMREDVRRELGQVIVPFHGVPSNDVRSDVYANGLVAIGFMQGIDALGATMHAIAAADRTLVELAALAATTESGVDPESSDDLVPRLFDARWRDRLTGSAVRFHRDKDDALIAEGPLVELLRELEKQ